MVLDTWLSHDLVCEDDHESPVGTQPQPDCTFYGVALMVHSCGYAREIVCQALAEWCDDPRLTCAHCVQRDCVQIIWL